MNKLTAWAATLLVAALGTYVPPSSARQVPCPIALGTPLVMEAKALDHIVRGDFGRDPKTGLRVIKGGLHTHEALDTFLTERPDISRLGRDAQNADVRGGNSDGWMFTIEDHVTGVTHLRLPRSAYSESARQNLWNADLSAQAGYLWKTLFPRGITADELRRGLTEVYESPDEFEDRGWAMVLDGRVSVGGRPPFRVRMVVDRKSGKLISAYPKFQQSGSLKSITPVGKGAVVTNLEYELANDESRTRTRKWVRDLLAVPVHDAGWWWSKSAGWNSLTLKRKQNVMSQLWNNDLDLLRSVTFLDRMASQSDIGYRPGALVEKTAEIMDAVRGDTTLDAASKLNLFARMVANHQVQDVNLVGDVVWGKFLIGTLLDFARGLEPAHQKFAIEVIERSPIYWLLLLPTTRDASREPDLPTAALKIVRLMGFGADWQRSSLAQMAGLPVLLRLSRRFAGLEWRYFQLLDRLEVDLPGTFSASAPRRKFLADFVNVQSQLVAQAEWTTTHSLRPLRAFGAERSAARVYDDWTFPGVRKTLRAQSDLVSRYLDFDHETWDRWVDWIGEAARGDAAGTFEGVDRFRLELSPKERQTLTDRFSPDHLIIYPELVVDAGKDGGFRVRPMLGFVEYVRASGTDTRE